NPPGMPLSADLHRVLATFWDNPDPLLIDMVTGRATRLPREIAVHAFSPDGSRAVIAREAKEGGARLWDLDVPKPLTPFLGSTEFHGQVLFSPDSRRMARLAGNTIR